MREISYLKLEKNSSPRSGPVTERITEKARENSVGNLIEPEAFQDEKNEKVSEHDTINPEKQREAIEKFKNLPEKAKNYTVVALKELAATPTKKSDKNTKEFSVGFTGKRLQLELKI